MFQPVAILGVIESLILDLPAALGQAEEGAAAELWGGKIRQPESLEDRSVRFVLPIKNDPHRLPAQRVPRVEVVGVPDFYPILPLPELNGLEATRQILEALPRTEVLILTLHESEQLIRRVVESGARACVLKSDAGRNLVEGVAALSRHKGFFSSTVATVVVESHLKGGKTTGRRNRSRDLLTPREREVVQLLAEGKSNKEIAATLGVSVHTGETHRSNIMHKLDTHSLSGLIRYALRDKIVQF